MVAVTAPPPLEPSTTVIGLGEHLGDFQRIDHGLFTSD
jgi:hypothetical protein